MHSSKMWMKEWSEPFRTTLNYIALEEKMLCITHLTGRKPCCQRKMQSLSFITG